MEEIKTMGLVIRETELGEADKLLTVLTPDYGKIMVTGKGVQSLRSPHMTSAQLFSYSSFVFKKSKKYFYIADSDMEECFFNIRFDVEKLSLAGYFCDIACDLALENVEDPELLRLMLNTLFALANKKEMPEEQIKAAFEFKAACNAGFMPILDRCGMCGTDELPDDVSFDVMNGMIKCPSCASALKKEELDPDTTAEYFFKLSPAVLSALRYVSEAGVSKFLSFSLPKDELQLFSLFCENYLISHLEHSFSSLKYYKDIKKYGLNYN